MTLEDRVHALRLRLFRRAEELGNVSEACREAGVSRSAYYKLRARFRRYGADGLHYRLPDLLICPRYVLLSHKHAESLVSHNANSLEYIWLNRDIFLANVQLPDR